MLVNRICKFSSVANLLWFLLLREIALDVVVGFATLQRTNYCIAIFGSNKDGHAKLIRSYGEESQTDRLKKLKNRDIRDSTERRVLELRVQRGEAVNRSNMRGVLGGHHAENHHIANVSLADPRRNNSMSTNDNMMCICRPKFLGHGEKADTTIATALKQWPSSKPRSKK